MSGRPKATAATALMPAISPTKAPVPVARRVEERQHEHAEDRAVEERAEPVDHLDERSEAARVHRDHAGEQPPDRRRHLRHPQHLRVGRRWTEMALVEVDHGRRRQRVQLGGNGVGRRRDDGDDPQADEPDRQRRHDEGREHVVHVGIARVAGRLPDEVGGPLLHRLHRRIVRAGTPLRHARASPGRPRRRRRPAPRPSAAGRRTPRLNCCSSARYSGASALARTARSCTGLNSIGGGWKT